MVVQAKNKPHNKTTKKTPLSPKSSCRK